MRVGQMPYNQAPLKPGSRPTEVLLDNGKKVVNNYDAIGRITNRSIGLGTAYDTNITYVPGNNGSKTALVATYKNSSDDAFSFQFDDCSFLALR